MDTLSHFVLGFDEVWIIDRLQKVDMFGATPHVFRHSYLSAMVEAGVDPKTVQQIGGHANITTTLNIYAHTRTGLVHEAGEKVGRLLTNNSPVHEADNV